MYAAAKFRETLNGLQSAARHGCQRYVRRNKQVAKSFARAAAYATTQLMQLTQSEVMGIVDDYSVDIGHIDSRLNDSGCQQHIIVMVGKVDYNFFELVGCHLSVSHHSARIGHQSFYHGFKVIKALDTVVDNKHLSVARHFKVDRLNQYVIV